MYLSLLVTWKFAPDSNPFRADAPPIALGEWVVRGVLRIGGDFLAFAVLGIAAARSARLRRSCVLTLLWALMLTAGLTFAILCIDHRGIPRPEQAVAPAVGAFLGVMVGLLWKRGRRRRVVAASATLLIGGLATLGTYGWLALEDAPLSLDPPDLTQREKNRLMKLLDGEQTGEGSERAVRLTNHDVNLLAEWGLSHLLPRSTSDVTFGDSSLNALVTVPIPGFESKHLNLDLAARTEMSDADVRVAVSRVGVGPFEIPAKVVDPVWQLMFARLRAHPQLQDLLGNIRRLQIEDGSAELVYDGDDLKQRLLPSFLASLSGMPDLSRETRLYVEHLVAIADELPQDDSRFQACVTTIFELAERRSADGDPVRENQAAIFALAVALGHRHIETLIGPVLDDASRKTLRKQFGYTQLRGRSDWCQHFVVSAALALITNEALSSYLGTVKEVRDADGGSGFSFADLMADQAGLRFARLAARDRVAARQLQTRIVEGFELDDLFPSPDGLPENLTEAQLQEQFGGVGGEKYRELEAEISRRLDECDLLEPSPE